jgi:hypothetical protein
MYVCYLDSFISTSVDDVNHQIKKLKPLKYNQFRWWRTHTDGINPLGKKADLKDKIENGDFNPSSYYFQAQLALHNAKNKLDLSKDDSQSQFEKTQIDIARYKKLILDYHREEQERLDNLYDSFISYFKISKDELMNLLENWEGNLLEFYYYVNEFYNTTKQTNRRGRPKKIK